MTLTQSDQPIDRNPWRAVAWLATGLAAFHLAYAFPRLGWLCSLVPCCWVAAVPYLSARAGFYGGLALGLAAYGPQLAFFWGLFGPAAILLWLILSFWLGLFLVLARRSAERWGWSVACALVPFLWTGLEYFRSELYYLRFSWLNAGYGLAGTPLAGVAGGLGVYGAGFVSALLGTVWILRGWRRLVAAGGCAAVLLLGSLREAPHALTSVPVAGMQLEESDPGSLVHHLDTLATVHPEAPLLVLHEYLLDGEVTGPLQAWCRRQGRWLVVGGRKTLAEGRWQNTAFVVDTNGAVVFSQGKSVPIQFFDDGEPAGSQALWSSPWGRLGIAICYDLSYTRVVDRLVAAGAQALLIPTMDSAGWGAHQHQLHALVAPTRAREHGLGVFRVASSGVSQLVGVEGGVLASAPYPGPGAMVAGELPIVARGRLPLDRWLAPVGVAVCAGVAVGLGRPRRRTAAPATAA